MTVFVPLPTIDGTSAFCFCVTILPLSIRPFTWHSLYLVDRFQCQTS